MQMRKVKHIVQRKQAVRNGNKNGRICFLPVPTTRSHRPHTVLCMSCYSFAIPLANTLGKYVSRRGKVQPAHSPAHSSI